MSLTRAFLIFVMFSLNVMAADVGLYDISDPEHPKPLKDPVGKVTISSQSNDNKHYYLDIDARDTFSLPCEKIALFAGTNTIRFFSQGEDTNGDFASMDATIDDADAVLIAQHFHTKIIKRRHPGEQMLVQFIPDKDAFDSSGPVVVTLRITNIGSNDFAFVEGGRQRGARDNQFAFSAEIDGPKIVGGRMVGQMLPDIGDPLNYGGLGSRIVLKPGQSEEIKVNLADWFKFEPHETYNVRGSYYMEFVDPNDRDFDTIWEDYACAEFSLNTK